MDEKTVVATVAPGRVGPGTQLNDLYQIDGLIAAGGMGEVYRGHVIETGDPVAIKTIRPDFAETANALALFRKEAAALHTVHHGAVVRYYVFSIDRRLNLPYLAMEHVTGESLAEITKRGPLGFESVDILRRRLASGFQAAHEAGIIHRDVSPDNVILPAGDPSRAKIIDFGIARASVAGQTIIGDGFAGKYAYVSPEQFGLQGGVVTPRSDIYSLGLVLAQACLGRPLDMGDTPADLIARRSVTPDLTGIDPRLAPLIAAMLRPDPDMRPASMADVAAWSPAPPIVRAPPPARAAMRGRALAAGIGGTLVLACGIAFVVLRPADDIPAPAETRPILAEPARPVPAAATPGPAVAPPPPATAGQAPAPSPTPSPSPATSVPPAGPVPVERSDPAPRPPADDAPPRIAALDTTAPPAKPLPEAAPTMEDVAAYIRAYRGGTCFFLNPTTVSRREAAIEAYGPAAEPFVAFDAAFKEAFGFEAKIQLRQIAPAQCPVVDLMARQAEQRLSSVPKLRLDHDRIRGGEELRGVVDLGDDRTLTLLLVDADGSVHDLAAHLTRNGRQTGFAVRLEAAAADRVRAQLVVAVASREPLALGREGLSGEAVFRAIGEAAARRDSGVGLAVRYVKTGS